MASLKNFTEEIAANRVRQQHQFMISIFNVSQNFTMTGDINKLGSNFDLYVQSTSLPERTLTDYELKKHGFTFRMPDILEFPGEWNTSMLLDQNMDIMRNLTRWQEGFSSLSNNMGGERFYGIAEAKVYALDHNMKKMSTDQTIVIKGLFPKTIPTVELTHEGTEVIKPDITWTYQYWYFESEGDPLAKAHNNA